MARVFWEQARGGEAFFSCSKGPTHPKDLHNWFTNLSSKVFKARRHSEGDRCTRCHILKLVGRRLSLIFFVTVTTVNTAEMQE